MPGIKCDPPPDQQGKQTSRHRSYKLASLWWVLWPWLQPRPPRHPCSPGDACWTERRAAGTERSRRRPHGALPLGDSASCGPLPRPSRSLPRRLSSDPLSPPSRAPVLALSTATPGQTSVLSGGSCLRWLSVCLPGCLGNSPSESFLGISEGEDQPSGCGRRGLSRGAVTCGGGALPSSRRQLPVWIEQSYLIASPLLNVLWLEVGKPEPASWGTLDPGQPEGISADGVRWEETPRTEHSGNRMAAHPCGHGAGPLCSSLPALTTLATRCGLSCRTTCPLWGPQEEGGGEVFSF
ncbi:uncharacterized protein LOC115287215 [Suricata suricatta]|uniref:uncharacterized protein LOC115287215 n=1 Tax=Suricata suricatta TaxID=37032 RepID=UPI0011553607|nr:uncharacterized protein LOC115287215 [Suricata suricatta]